MLTTHQPTQCDARILVFAKAPQPGQAKTRLIPLMGSEGAAQLQAHLTRRTIGMSISAEIGSVELWCAPHADFAFFRLLAAEQSISLHTQCEGDLGRKMEHAANQSLSPGQPVLIIGTDCPLLTPGHLQRAAQTLHQGYDTVLIPAEDGGYVLIGLTRMAPTLFDNIAWGTEQVLTATQTRLTALDWKVLLMDPLPDLDHPGDCEQLARNHPELWQALTTANPSP
jgi:rSAM/selenodomain-associated transferase 1